MRRIPYILANPAPIPSGTAPEHTGRVKCLAIIFATAATAFAQASATVVLSNGVELHVQASFGQPTGQQNLTVELARASGNSFYRIFRDQNNLAVFAYELAVDRPPTGGEIHFTAKPTEEEFAARHPNADAGKPVPTLSAEQEIRPSQSGGSAQIGLFEIPGMGLKVSDSVQVKIDRESVSAGAGSRIRFAGLQVTMDGTVVSGEGAPTPVSGRYAMFYIPGKGGYFFSTESPIGRVFLKSGSIDGSKMRFAIDNDMFECTAAGTILENGVSGEVWVFHDPAYQPSGNWTRDLEAADQQPAEFFTAAADSLNWWLP